MITSAIFALLISFVTLISFLFPTASSDITSIATYASGAISTIVDYAVMLQSFFPVYTLLYAITIGVLVEISLAGYHFVLWFGRRTHILG